MVQPIQYESPEKAYEAGHLRLCGYCSRGNYTNDEEIGTVYLTVEQVNTLEVIIKIYDKDKVPLTLSQIAAARNRKTSSCFRIVNGLEERKLITKRRGKTGNKAVNGCVIPTPAAYRVLASLKAQ